MRSDLSGRLEELDRVAVGIFHLNLPPTGTDFHRVAELDACVFQPLNVSGEIGSPKADAVPSARFLGPSIWHRARTRGLRSAEQELQVAERHRRKCRKLLMFQCEAKMLGVERYSATDVLDLIADAMQSESDFRSGTFIRYCRGRALIQIHESSVGGS